MKDKLTTGSKAMDGIIVSYTYDQQKIIYSPIDKRLGVLVSEYINDNSNWIMLLPAVRVYVADYTSKRIMIEDIDETKREIEKLIKVLEL